MNKIPSIKNLPLKIEYYKQVTADLTYALGYDEWVVIINGFIVAHFVDEMSCKGYVNYLMQGNGVQFFPKSIIEILYKQYESGVIKKHSV